MTNTLPPHINPDNISNFIVKPGKNGPLAQEDEQTLTLTYTREGDHSLNHPPETIVVSFAIDLIDPQWHCTLTVGNSDIAFAFTADNYKDVLYVAYKKAEQLIQLWTWTIQDYNVQKLISLANKEKHHA